MEYPLRHEERNPIKTDFHLEALQRYPELDLSSTPNTHLITASASLHLYTVMLKSQDKNKKIFTSLFTHHCFLITFRT